MNSRSAGACFPKHVQFNSYIIRWRRERERERVKYRICITKNANQMHRQETYSQRARHGDHSGLKMCSVWRITLILWDFHSGSGWFDAIASSLWMFCKLTREMRKGRGSEKTKCRKWKKNHFFFWFFLAYCSIFPLDPRVTAANVRACRYGETWEWKLFSHLQIF